MRNTTNLFGERWPAMANDWASRWVINPPQTLSVPDCIADVPLARYPLSLELTLVARELALVKLADLRPVTLSQLERLSYAGHALFWELECLIERVHRDSCTPQAAPEGVDRPQAEPSRRGPDPALYQPLFCDSEDQDKISVPAALGDRLLTDLPCTQLALRVFDRARLTYVRELEGVYYERLLYLPSCGPKSVHAVRDLVAALQAGPPPPVTQLPPRRSAPPDQLFIPERCRALNLFDLPLSRRLQQILRRRRWSTLGDLHLRRFNELYKERNFGKVTFAELHAIIRRVAAGEFDAPSREIGLDHLGELVRLVERLLQQLLPRDRQVLWLCLSGEQGACLTLQEIASKLSLSRERVRQIESHTLTRLRREGGPKLASLLRGLAAVCQRQVLPLTTALLAGRLGPEYPSLSLPLAGYILLLGRLNPEFPVWPEGQRRGDSPHSAASPAETLLTKFLKSSASGVELKVAYDQLRGQARTRKLSVLDFLEMLRGSSRFQVDQFPPDQPVVRMQPVPHHAPGERVENRLWPSIPTA